MTRPRFARVQSHFLDAVDLQGEDLRVYMEHLQSEDPSIAADVVALLQSHDQSDDFFNDDFAEPSMRSLLDEVYDAWATPDTLRTPASGEGFQDTGPTGIFDSDDGLPQRIGPYPVLQKLGAGGMGEVYLVQETEPVKKKVALKVLNRAHTSKEALARFRAEAQALALMQHHNIAQLFHFEAKDPRLAFFTMEYIVGEPIHIYCEQHELSVEARLDLFLQVCDGVFHAHQKGIIHRDLKPNNIMIATQDGHPVAKVIDFGIAKAIEGEGRDAIATMMTANNALVGTPAYMPPEQVAEQAGKSHVDTRSDIYAMGAILYQLLTDQTLIDPFLFRQMNWGQRIDTLRNPRVVKPSQCLQGLDELKQVAEKRGVSGKGLIHKLMGDLDLVIMKCLAVEPDERYASVDQLRGDLRSWLEGRPVSVMPPSTFYRIKKYVKRNQGPVIAGCLILISLVTGLSAALVSRQNAVAAKALAVEAQGETESALKKADAVQRFLQSIIASPDPYRNGPDVKLVDVLRDAESQIAEDFAGQPEVEARIRYSIGRSYDSLGLLVEARQQLEIADEIFSKLEDIPEDYLVGFYVTYGVVLSQNDVKEGEDVLNKAYSMAVEQKDVENKLWALSNIALHLIRERKYAESIDLYEKCIRLARENDFEDFSYRLGLADALDGLGKRDEASEIYNALFYDVDKEIRGRYLRVLVGYTKNRIGRNKLDGLESILLEGRKVSADLYGEGHYYTTFVDYNLSLFYAKTGSVDTAFYHAKLAYERRKELYGESNLLTVDAKKMYVNLLVNRIPMEDAVEELTSYRDFLKSRGEQRTDAYLSIVNNISYCLNRLGEYERSIENITKTIEEFGSNYSDVRLMFSSFNLGESYGYMEEYDKAIENYSKSLALAESSYAGVEYYKTYAECKIGFYLWKKGEGSKGKKMIADAYNYHKSLEHSSLFEEIEGVYNATR